MFNQPIDEETKALYREFRTRTLNPAALSRVGEHMSAMPGIECLVAWMFLGEEEKEPCRPSAHQIANISGIHRHIVKKLMECLATQESHSLAANRDRLLKEFEAAILE